MKISLQALIPILAKSQIKYVIEKSTNFDDRDVLKFSTAHGYPSNASFIYITRELSDQESMRRDRVIGNSAPILHYDVKTGTVVGACAPIHSILKDIINNLKSK